MAALGAMAAGDVENFVAAATPGGIEAQEARGQRHLAKNDLLPRDGTSGNARPQWEAMGFKFQEKSGDDIFISAEFPAGWQKKPTDHSMWSDLLDDKGRKRASIFYKAAFYDRSAHTHLVRRYTVSAYHGGGTGKPVEEYEVVALDGDKVLKSFGKWKSGDYSEAAQDRRQALTAEAEAWLTEHFPQHADPTAYWD